ncbi:NAD-dependent epimerase/dehydratase family protein [Arthrobacter deserti]|uniref:NAD-dependent epimerase/dehydratase family protein n=1 Tax=Arthrobacter deserti TaxID=1742687 RepID=A0ABX1JMP4_9MICC|nr:NAD-dependent epimerase/dehydratase family protein [Arthrobacter deserti]
MKALVTGAAGFVGSTLTRRLLGDGHEVVGIDLLTDYYDVGIKQANLAGIAPERFEFRHEDLNRADLDALLAGVDVVFHQAGQPGVRKSWGEDFGVYLDANVRATQALLGAAKRAGTLQRFVYASSSPVYGDAERFPTPESHRPQPLSPYGVTKLAAEHLCSLYAANFGVPAVSLRYFTVYGPGQRPDMAFTRFVRAAVRGVTITVYGTGEQIRDFTYVDDVVEANMRAALGSAAPGAVFNVAGGSNIAVNGVLSLLQELNGGALDVRYVDKVAGDVWRTGGSTHAIEAALGWKAEISLDEGLSRQLEWARETF